MSKPTAIERLERTDPDEHLELVTYDAAGNETSRKSPTGYDICRVRRRERRQGIETEGVTWGSAE